MPSMVPVIIVEVLVTFPETAHRHQRILRGERAAKGEKGARAEKEVKGVRMEREARPHRRYSPRNGAPHVIRRYAGLIHAG